MNYYFKRFLAFLIDVIILTIAYIIIIFLVGVWYGFAYLKPNLDYDETRMQNVIQIYSFGIFIFFTYLIYYGLLESSVKQGTFGKQFMKLKVCDLNYKKLNYFHALRRVCMMTFSSMILFLGYLPIFSKLKQTLHDKISGCLVVEIKSL